MKDKGSKSNDKRTKINKISVILNLCNQPEGKEQGKTIKEQ